MIIELPQVGESVTEGVIGRWLKSPGERVERFDPLVEVVTDKVNMEMPSPVSGTLTAIIAAEGETVPMGAPIAEMEVEGEVAASEPDAGATGTAETVQEAPADRIGTLLKDVAPVGPTGSGGPISSGTASEASAREAGAGTRAAAGTTSGPTSGQASRRGGRAGRRRHSPAVLRLADEHGVDLARLERIAGTGIGGRVTVKDLRGVLERGMDAAADSAPAVEAGPAPDEERVPLSAVRRMIAENMVRSATDIPQAWTLVEVDVSGLVARRAAARDEFRRREGINITYLPFVMKAVAESLKENPLLNSSWGGDSIIYKRRVNIGIAAATPNGLVVPVVHDADTLSVAGLARRLDDLTTRARSGRLTLEDVQGGTFTLNNTGALGSALSQPLVNHPQAAILTTEAIVKRPVVVGDGIAIRSMMNVCMSFDHRVMDGAEASAFINAVKRRLEGIGADTGVY